MVDLIHIIYIVTNTLFEFMFELMCTIVLSDVCDIPSFVMSRIKNENNVHYLTI